MTKVHDLTKCKLCVALIGDDFNEIDPLRTEQIRTEMLPNALHFKAHNQVMHCYVHTQLTSTVINVL